MAIQTVALTNMAKDVRVRNDDPRCCVILKNGKQCFSSSRWEFTLEDGSTIRVCRLHANTGENRGELRVLR